MLKTSLEGVLAAGTRVYSMAGEGSEERGGRARGCMRTSMKNSRNRKTFLKELRIG